MGKQRKLRPKHTLENRKLTVNEKRLRPLIERMLTICSQMLDQFVNDNKLIQKNMRLLGRTELSGIDLPVKLNIDYDDGYNICRIPFDIDWIDTKPENELKFRLKLGTRLLELQKVINYSKESNKGVINDSEQSMSIPSEVAVS